MNKNKNVNLLSTYLFEKLLKLLKIKILQYALSHKTCV